MRRSLSGRVLRWGAATRSRQQAVGRTLRALAPLLRSKPPPRDPVFILGSPRSGTTLTFDILNRSSALASLDSESHLLWNMYHDVGDWRGRSHALGPDAIAPGEAKVLNWAIDRITMGSRYLDKFPRNCLRVPYLQALFPDAYFLYIKRDGRAAVSSLITGWRTEGSKFGRGTRLPLPLSIEGYTGEVWRFLLPPGWERYVSGVTLEEVAAFQWSTANEAVLAAKDSIRPDRWVEVGYEDLVASPRDTVAGLLHAMDLPIEDSVLSWAGDIDAHVSKMAVTPPRADKWRQENPREIERILPMIAPMMERLGYAAER